MFFKKMDVEKLLVEVWDLSKPSFFVQMRLLINFSF